MSYVHGVYVADGFADDCDELMHRCLQVSTLTFETFSDIWRDMQLSCIFKGRTSGAEIAELSEEVLHIAKHYLVADTSNFEESVAGLFLVYSLMNLQPYTNFASLRIIQDDIPALRRIELVARRSRRLDVLYVLGSVLIQGPVQYHAAVRERGMEFPIRKYLEGTAVDKLGVRPKGVFYRQNTELDLIKEISCHTFRYTALKENITGIPRDDRNLKYLDPMFATELDISLKNLISGITHYNNGGNSNNTSDTIRNIKNKAMKAQVKPIRNRVGIYNKNPICMTINTAVEPRGNRKSSTSSEDSDCTDKELLNMDELPIEYDIDMAKFDRAVASSEYRIATDSNEIGKTYEIEFIDHFDQPSTSGLNTKPSSSIDTHKRDLKNTIVKSRFKRMGMDIVANFESK